MAAAEVDLRDAWIRWLPAGAPMAGYFTLENASARPIALIGATSASYASASLHETVRRDDGTTTMRRADLPLEVAAGERLVFAPGGFHVMLREPQRAITPGDQVKIELRTESGERLTATFEVRTATGE
ncbi:MAG: copper chaperone PCu(A)C [Halofilum sp. (in: g-proteobacteria)]|nr:copper chaperone PCu(A)C [Halofilum sp. (in: g-proteobacteria)]